MKLNKTKTKKTNFFLKISACAMLICVLLAVFILPSSASLPEVGSSITVTVGDKEFDVIYGGQIDDEAMFDGVYYHVVLNAGSRLLTYYDDSASPINVYIPDNNLNLYYKQGETYKRCYLNTGSSNQGGPKTLEFTIGTQVAGMIAGPVPIASGQYGYDISTSTRDFLTDDLNNLNVTYGFSGAIAAYLLDHATITVYNLPDEPSPIDTILGVFLGITEWLGDALIAVIPAFWTGTELTILGVLAVAALAVALVLLLVSFVRKFLQFRG